MGRVASCWRWQALPQSLLCRGLPELQCALPGNGVPTQGLSGIMQDVCRSYCPNLHICVQSKTTPLEVALPGNVLVNSRIPATREAETETSQI